ncbi:drug/metabolite transporter (DMT)-like permease [Treponema rectale]|uniref:Drug/metabolite transporter (DMT)-like permease n=1 Tax=Treponema rectale TaxID=744512 RepID=A0A840SAF8_9SPIR|nr:EamA family transporter [Treponema rectale]MBB5218697.1 drug/metabolite transporter (DMT)-like permease [Treponema rectale]
MWIALVLFYGICKGIREVGKKEALKTSSTFEVLLIYSAISFLFVLPDFKNAMGLEAKYYGYIGIKSSVIFLAWIFSFIAIKKLPISLYGVLDLSRVLFASFSGLIILHETMNLLQWTGLALVCIGLISLKFSKKKTCESSEKTQKPQTAFVILAFASCALNGISGLLDKILMRQINSSQLQFWYMLFIVLLYTAYSIITKQNIRIVKTLKNPWVWLISILFVISDRALFIANGMEGSRITVMTMLKQSGTLVTILAGKFIYKEESILHKLICAAIIVTGILFGVLFKDEFTI